MGVAQCCKAQDLCPRHSPKSIVGYDNVTINRHFYSYLEGNSNDLSVRGILHLLHISASPSAHRNQPMSSEITTNVCTTSTLMKYQEILMHVYPHSAL